MSAPPDQHGREKNRPGPKKVYLQPKMPPQKPRRANVPLQRVKQVTDSEYRIVLLGRTGAGKSALGNMIFAENVFMSGAASRSQTSRCNMHKKVVQGYPLVIVDTPGLFDTSKPNNVVKKEILKLLAVTAPGPHAIILVIPIHMRYTEEMRQASEYFQHIFGIEAQAYTMVVFTGADHLEADDTSFEEYIAAAPVPLTKLLGEVQHRYIAFDNRSKSDEKREIQLGNLIKAIRDMVASNRSRNGCEHYTNESFEAADKALDEKDEERVQHLETEKARKLHKLRYPSEDHQTDLGIEGTAKYMANYQKQCALISEEINLRIGNAREDLRQSVIDDKPEVIVTEAWFTRAVKMVASALGFRD